MEENAAMDIGSDEIIETEGESTENTDAPLTPQEKKRINSLKYKFNGKEYDEKLPFEIDDDPAQIAYLQKQIQMAKLAQSKSQEYSNLEKDSNTLKQEINQFFHELKTNPKKALSNPLVGIDIKMLAAEILEEALAEEEKSPEQREKEKLQARLTELEAERKKEKEDAENTKYQATLERAYERYDNALESTLTKNPDLPQTPYIVEKMTKYMAFMVEEGYEPDMEIIAEQVRNEMNGDIKHLLSILPVDKVEQILGTEVLGKLRKSRLAKAKVAPPTLKSQVKDVAAQKVVKEEKPAAKQTMKQFFKV